MDVKMKDENFIRIIDEAMTHEQCAKLIDGFHAVHDNGGSYTRQELDKTSKDLKADTGINSAALLIENLYSSFQEQMLVMLNKHITDYVQDYETGMFGIDVGNEFPMSQSGTKIQMTKPSEGYHVWHCENSSLLYKGRFITWILYLNDIDDGGETEFIHLSKRVAPKTGRLVIFPAGWTHAHRGNPPLKDTKYIATGWMEYTV
jgi:hypothetical protein